MIEAYLAEVGPAVAGTAVQVAWPRWVTWVEMSLPVWDVLATVTQEVCLQDGDSLANQGSGVVKQRTPRFYWPTWSSPSWQG